MQWVPPIDVLKSALPDNVTVQRQQKNYYNVIEHRVVVIVYIYDMAVYVYNLYMIIYYNTLFGYR